MVLLYESIFQNMARECIIFIREMTTIAHILSLNAYDKYCFPEIKEYLDVY